MSPVLIATLAGLVTAFCWGTSDWLAARCTKRLSPVEVNLTVQVVSMVMVAIIFLFAGVHVDNWGQVIRIICSNGLITTAYLLFVRALSAGAVGIIVPLGNMYPFFTLILSMIFLSTHFTSLEVSAMLGIVLGATLLGFEKNHKKLPLKELHRDTMLALLAALLWGAGFFVVSPVVSQLSWQSIAIVGEIISLPIALVLVLISSRHDFVSSIKRSLSSRTAIMAGGIGMTGVLALYYGGNHAGSIVIPTVLSGGGPLVASLWGVAIDHERIGSFKRVGAVVLVSGIMLLNV